MEEPKPSKLETFLTDLTIAVVIEVIKLLFPTLF